MAKRKPKKPEQAVRPGLLYAGVAILVAVLAFALVNFLFLGDGGGGDEAEPTQAPSSQGGGAPAPAPEPTAAPQHPTAEQIGLFQGRDPFRPVAGGVAPLPTPTPAPTPVPTPAPTAAPPPAAQPSADALPVEVLSVAEDESVATIKIEETVHENAKPRDTLSQGFVLDRIELKCVDMHRGNEPSFRVCEGERVLK